MSETDFPFNGAFSHAEQNMGQDMYQAGVETAKAQASKFRSEELVAASYTKRNNVVAGSIAVFSTIVAITAIAVMPAVIVAVYRAVFQ